MKYLPVARTCVQITVLALFCMLPLLHAHDFYRIKGSLFALDVFGIPFADPASASQAFFGTLWQEDGAARSFYIGALVTLIVAFALGRVFCGWLCPYGLFSEIFTRFRLRQSSSRHEFTIKLALAALALSLAALYPLISLMSMPGQISLLPQALWREPALGIILELAIIPFGILVVEAFAGKRLWCRYICPQSVFLGLASGAKAAIIPGLRITWNGRKCTCGKNAPCQTACSLGLNPRLKQGPKRRDCSMCGRCVAVCAEKGKALKFAFSGQRAEKK